MLDAQTIERLTAKAGDGPILIALSGGGDSVALMHLLRDGLGAAQLRAAIVDHALREGSAADAERALGFAQALNIHADILTLSWPDGPRRGQEDARTARYAALCEHARALGARAIAVAHNADDQAETIMMRMASKSGERGLAGIPAFAPAPIWPEGRGVWIARPLLDVRRAELRDYLRAHGAGWLEDPANTNTAFERVRVRQALAERESAGEAYLEPLLLMAKEQRTRADALAASAYALTETVTHFDADAVIIDRTQWRGASGVRCRALSALIAAAAGAAREPSANATARLEAEITAPGFSGATLGGAVLSPRAGAITLRRDQGALSGRADGAAPTPHLPLTYPQPIVWDRRVELSAPEPGWSVIVEQGAPVLARGAERLPLSAAKPHWLLAERVKHLLGVD